MVYFSQLLLYRLIAREVDPNSCTKYIIKTQKSGGSRPELGGSRPELAGFNPPNPLSILTLVTTNSCVFLSPLQQQEPSYEVNGPPQGKAHRSHKSRTKEPAPPPASSIDNNKSSAYGVIYR